MDKTENLIHGDRPLYRIPAPETMLEVVGPPQQQVAAVVQLIIDQLFFDMEYNGPGRGLGCVGRAEITPEQFHLASKELSKVLKERGWRVIYQVPAVSSAPPPLPVVTVQIEPREEPKP